MKKNIKFLILGIISLIVLIVTLLLINLKSNNDLEHISNDSGGQIIKIFDKNFNDITSVNIKNSSGEFTIDATYDQDNPLYKIDNIALDKQPSQSIIKTFMHELINLIPSKIVEETSEELNKYGLEHPNSSIKVTFKDNSYKILNLGNEAPLSLGNYLTKDQENSLLIPQGDRWLR